MGTMAQSLELVLLAIIAVVAVIGMALLLRAAAAIRRLQQDTHQVLASRDLGPVLHGLVQQIRDVNRLLANIDKRLEKLEALEKVQIANLTFREELPRPKRP
jgi:type II secretory pathway component PulK